MRNRERARVQKRQLSETEEDESEEEAPFPFMRLPSPSALPTPSHHTHLYSDGSPWIGFENHNRRVVDAISRELAGKGGPQLVVFPRPVQQQGVAVHNRLPYVTDADGRGITPIYIYICIHIYISCIYTDIYIYYIYNI